MNVPKLAAHQTPIIRERCRKRDHVLLIRIAHHDCHRCVQAERLAHNHVEVRQRVQLVVSWPATRNVGTSVHVVISSEIGRGECIRGPKGHAYGQGRPRRSSAG